MSAISFSVSCLFSSDDDRKSAPAVPRRFSAKGRAWHAAADTPSGWQDRAFCHTLLLGTQAVSRQGKPLPRPAALRRREFCKRRFSDAARAKHADDASVRNGQGNILQNRMVSKRFAAVVDLKHGSTTIPSFRPYVSASRRSDRLRLPSGSGRKTDSRMHLRAEPATAASRLRPARQAALSCMGGVERLKLCLTRPFPASARRTEPEPGRSVRRRKYHA